MLFQRSRKIAGFVIDLHACHDGKFKRVQKRDGLTSPFGRQTHDDGGHFSQPVRRLNNRYARLLDELENLEGLERM